MLLACSSLRVSEVAREASRWLNAHQHGSYPRRPEPYLCPVQVFLSLAFRVITHVFTTGRNPINVAATITAESYTPGVSTSNASNAAPGLDTVVNLSTLP